MTKNDIACPQGEHWPWGIALFFFLACMVWFGRDLNFSAYAHPDERNKINQIVHSSYNFNHPLMMLNSARVTAWALDKTTDFEAVKMIGRKVSVLYASLAVGVFALAIGRLYGRWAALATGIFSMCNPNLFEFAHYFKEEPTLLFGISLTVLAMVYCSLRPGLAASMFCGATSGMAFSGKYAGIIIMPFALYLILAKSHKKIRDAIFFIILFALIFILINLPAFLSFAHAAGSLDNEVVRLTGANLEVKRSIPHGVYTQRYLETASPVLLALLFFYLFCLFKRRFHLQPVEWALTLLPALFFVVLSFIPVTSNRYFLPCGILCACLSASGLAFLMRWKNGFWIGIVLIILSIGWSLPKLLKSNNGFSRDHVGELASYLEAEVPSDSLILVGQWIGVPPIKSPHWRYYPIGPEDTIEGIRSKGFTHVLLAPKNYRNFINTTQNRTSLSNEDFSRLKSFYQNLFDKTLILRQWKETDNSNLGKEMVLFSIKDVSTKLP
jgi:MFS family permease